MKKSILIYSLFGAMILLVTIFMVVPQIINDPLPSPRGRDAWRAMMRGGKIEPEKMLKASHEMRSLIRRARIRRDAGLHEWEQIGPDSVGGRVRAFAVHPSNPNVLYTGGVGGGIFKSTNGGTTWFALEDFLPSLSVTAILVHPTTPSIVYAATGEGITGGDTFLGSSPGAGIFKSADAGQTWNLIDALDQENLDGFYWVNDLAFDPSDPSVFYAVAQGSNGANHNFGCANIYRITNDGAVIDNNMGNLPCVGTRTTAWSVYINPNDADHIMVGHKDGLYITWDGGDNWSSHIDVTGFPSFPLRVEVAMSASDANVVYALCQGQVTATVARSTDMGMTWNTQASGLTLFNGPNGNSGDYHNVIWIDPDDSDNLIIGGIDLYRSTNQGVTFTQISDWSQHDQGLSAHADHHIIVAASDYDPNTNRTLYFGNDGGIARTSNWKTVSQTSGWEILNEGLVITQFYASDIDGNNPTELIAGSQDNGTWYSGTSGDSWRKVSAGDGGYPGLAKLATGPNYSSSQNGVFYINLPPSLSYLNYFDLSAIDNTSFITPMEIYPNDPEKILVGGNFLWMVDYDPGNPNDPLVKNVSPPGTPGGEFVSAIALTEDSSLVAYGYTDGSIYINDDGTAGSWTDISLPVTGTVTGIAINPINNNKIMATIGGYRDDNIWFSNDGGASWEVRSVGVPALQVNDITWHPDVSSWVYIGTDMGVMASENNGNEWNVSPGQGVNDGPAMVEVSQVEFSRNNTFSEHWLVATTFGRGIWKTSFTVREAVYIDEDCVGCGIGIQGAPLQTIQEAEERQASGQTWIFDAGPYPVTSKVVIDKRLNKIEIIDKDTIVIGN